MWLLIKLKEETRIMKGIQQPYPYLCMINYYFIIIFISASGYTQYFSTLSFQTSDVRRERREDKRVLTSWASAMMIVILISYIACSSLMLWASRVVSWVSDMMEHFEYKWGDVRHIQCNLCNVKCHPDITRTQFDKRGGRISYDMNLREGCFTWN